MSEKWISVDERMPNLAGVYRVTRYCQKPIPYYRIDYCFFDGSDTWHNDNRINHERAYLKDVIAWQENPEPYKPEKVNDEVNDALKYFACVMCDNCFDKYDCDTCVHKHDISQKRAAQIAIKHIEGYRATMYVLDMAIRINQPGLVGANADRFKAFLFIKEKMEKIFNYDNNKI